MATQVIQIPSHLIRALLDADLWEKWLPGIDGWPRIVLGMVHPAQSEAAIAVLVKDSRLVPDNWRFQGSAVFTLLLTPQSDPARDYLPRPVTDDLLVPVIQALIPAVCSSLCGHDALELGGLLDGAMRQRNALPLPPRVRHPVTRYERRLRETALLLQRRFAPALADLQGEIAVYGERLLRSGLGPAIGSLAQQGALGDRLSLKPSASDGCLEPYHDDPESIASLLHEAGQSSGIRYMTEWMLGEMAPYNACQRRDLSTFHVMQLYGRAFANIDTDRIPSLWRHEDSRGTGFPMAVPAAGIGRAMLRFAAAFDQRLLIDVDPLIKGALCWHEILRIQPFGRFDREVAELLLHVLLRQAGLPPTPLPMIMHQRSRRHAQMLPIALERDQSDCLVAAIIAAMGKALKLGSEIMHRLGEERERLMDALADDDAPLVDILELVSELLASVMVREAIGLDLAGAAQREEAFRYLHSKGLIDKIVIGNSIWWSLAATRQLTRCNNRGH